MEMVHRAVDQVVEEALAKAEQVELQVKEMVVDLVIMMQPLIKV
jgi:ribosomal protein L22